MTRYSEEQIRDAIQKAAEKNTPGPVYAWELSMYKKVIDALPEPQDEWEACAFEDIRKGDRVKYETGTATVIPTDPVQGRERNDLILADGSRLLRHFVQTFYRIPAPVQHPDPEVHKYILDVDGDLWIWSKSQRKYIEPETLVQSAPAEFDEWSPAKITPLED